jgi:DNA-binding transcriptional LysR family regulator
LENVATILAAFRERFPDVVLELAEHDFCDPSAGLAAGDVDLAFIMPPIAQLIAARQAVGLAAAWAAPIFARADIAFVPVSDVEPATTALAWPRGSEDPVAARFAEVAREVAGAAPGSC